MKKFFSFIQSQTAIRSQLADVCLHFTSSRLVCKNLQFSLKFTEFTISAASDVVNFKDLY